MTPSDAKASKADQSVGFAHTACRYKVIASSRRPVRWQIVPSKYSPAAPPGVEEARSRDSGGDDHVDAFGRFPIEADVVLLGREVEFEGDGVIQGALFVSGNNTDEFENGTDGRRSASASRKDEAVSIRA